MTADELSLFKEEIEEAIAKYHQGKVCIGHSSAGTHSYCSAASEADVQ